MIETNEIVNEPPNENENCSLCWFNLSCECEKKLIPSEELLKNPKECWCSSFKFGIRPEREVFWLDSSTEDRIFKWLQKEKGWSFHELWVLLEGPLHMDLRKTYGVVSSLDYEQSYINKYLRD